MILLTLGGCLDRLLESPYILLAGLGEPRSLAVGMGGELLVGGDQGVRPVVGGGTGTPLWPGGVDAIAQNPEHLYVLGGGRVASPVASVGAPGAVDVSASWFEEIWVLYPDHLDALDRSFRSRRVASGLVGARTVNLGLQDEMLVTTPTEVRAYGRDGSARVVVAGLEEARVAAVDEAGRTYVVHRADPELYRVDPAGLTLIARFLEDPRDLQFGFGPSLPHDFVYIASGRGRVDYLQVPP